MWTVLTWSITHCSPASAYPDEIGRTVADMLESLQAAPNFETLMTILLNDIVALSTRLALVIDDYHVITATAIHNLLSLVLNNLPVPSGMHLVLTSRANPPLHLSRLRVGGQITESRSHEVRLTAKRQRPSATTKPAWAWRLTCMSPTRSILRTP
jgi:ATP/maltotriose-dependent transcriptional regulator MalT